MMHILLKTAQMGQYHGFERRDFWFEGHQATVIFPRQPREDGSWIWRAEFLGAFDTVDVAMLERGYYVTYYSVSNMYGCPQSVALMKKYYDFCVGELGFAQKTVLLGFSRGGLYACNFALTHPQTVRALYLDAPVLDIRSWPCRSGVERDLSAQCMQVYGLDQVSVKTFARNPLDRVQELIDADIPVAVVAGDSDLVVPHTENCQPFIEYYEQHHGRYLYVLKEGCAHHPHSLEDPSPVVDFLTAYED